MTRRGRRSGRTLLNARQADARRRAIAKLDARRGPYQAAVDALQPTIRLLSGPPRLETIGHHLQRAAAENA